MAEPERLPSDQVSVQCCWSGCFLKAVVTFTPLQLTVHRVALGRGTHLSSTFHPHPRNPSSQPYRVGSWVPWASVDTKKVPFGSSHHHHHAGPIIHGIQELTWILSAQWLCPVWDVSFLLAPAKACGVLKINEPACTLPRELIHYPFECGTCMRTMYVWGSGAFISYSVLIGENYV